MDKHAERSFGKSYVLRMVSACYLSRMEQMHIFRIQFKQSHLFFTYKCRKEERHHQIHDEGNNIYLTALCITTYLMVLSRTPFSWCCRLVPRSCQRRQLSKGVALACLPSSHRAHVGHHCTTLTVRDSQASCSCHCMTHVLTQQTMKNPRRL